MKLLFVPGSGAGRAIWFNQTAAFPGSVAVALPGHPEGKACPTVDGYSTWLHEHIRTQGYRDVVLAGHSLGGGVVLDYAIRYPGELKGIVLIGTGARLRVNPVMTAALEKLPEDKDGLRRFLGRARGFGEQTLAPEAYEETLKIGLAVLKNDLRACDSFDVMARLPEIKIPALVIVGEHDDLTPVKFARYLAEHIAGAAFVEVPGAGHTLCVTHPDAVNDAIRTFLTGLA
jgi:pimeloyl-ACP methyl ester carboxylesterase